ncbi:NAD(P)-binding protein, partial [Candidatus Poriferisodalis multihospitum]|uniref:NAD(P)-binding protein n=1 Tax=Candidatus Poriferisodalis multihospitum TaxID=2983191 RepID=UPI002B25B9C0
TQRRIAIIGGGMSGLGAAWALAQHPDRFDFRLFEANDRLGGNAFTADMPQDDGTSIPFDISVTALIPSVYDHVLLLLERFGIELFETKFNYSVKYQGGRYAHDFDSAIRDQLQPEIERFQRLLRRLHSFGRLTRARSKLLNALNPSGVLRHRIGDAHADLGPGHAAHLRIHDGGLHGQDPPEPARAQGVPRGVGSGGGRRRRGARDL